MLHVSVIGHLGADAVCQSANGKEFVSFRVAHTEKFTDDSGHVSEQTTWVDCIMNGRPNVLQYLRKGTQVYCTGSATLRVYDSAKYRCKMAGLQCRVRDLQLLAAPKSNENNSEHDDQSNNAAETNSGAPF